MGKEFTGLTCEQLCDLMCGDPEEDYDEEEESWLKVAEAENAVAEQM